jgi:hypothetical protein
VGLCPFTWEGLPGKVRPFAFVASGSAFLILFAAHIEESDFGAV